jgi:hypothetical protein
MMRAQIILVAFVTGVVLVPALVIRFAFRHRKNPWEP